MKRILILFSLLLSLSSCYTIHFTGTSQLTPPEEYEFTKLASYWLGGAS